MEQLKKCPVCGNLHKRTYEMMEIWGGMEICEDYFNCSDCGYWSAMAYSPYVEGIEFVHSFKQVKLLLKNWKKARPYLDGKFGFKKCMM